MTSSLRGITVGVFIVALCCACTPGNTVATTTVTVTKTIAVRAPMPTTPTPAGPLTVIDRDGTYLVGQDITPGRYRTAGTRVSGMDCYWKRLGSLNTSDIIDNEGSPGPQIVDILATDVAFSTARCQPWQKVS